MPSKRYKKTDDDMTTVDSVFVLVAMSAAFAFVLGVILSAFVTFQEMFLK